MRDSIRWAIGRGLPVMPVLEADWSARGTLIAQERYAWEGRSYPGSFARPLVLKPGFLDISHGASVENGGTLESTRTGVILGDAKGEMRSFLERYFPKRSPARIYLASPELIRADWEELYVGVVEAWTQKGPNLELTIGPDNGPMDAEAPKVTIDQAVFPAAPDVTVFGIPVPFVMGVLDAFQTSARGSVAAIPVMYNEDLGYRWLASGKYLHNIRRIYFDGTLQPSSIWTVTRGVFGSAEMTMIDVIVGSQPNADAIVTFDCEGPDATGYAIGATLTNPISQIRAFLENYVFGDLRVGPYASHPKIHAASWDALATLYVKHEADDCGVVFGGNREKQTGRAILETLLAGNDSLRAWWTPSGQIAVGVIDSADDEVPGAYTNLDRAPKVEHETPRTTVYSDVNVSWLWSSAEQRYLASHRAQDIGVAEWLDPPATLAKENLWSPARYTRT